MRKSINQSLYENPIVSRRPSHEQQRSLTSWLLVDRVRNNIVASASTCDNDPRRCLTGDTPPARSSLHPAQLYCSRSCVHWLLTTIFRTKLAERASDNPYKVARTSRFPSPHCKGCAFHTSHFEVYTLDLPRPSVDRAFCTVVTPNKRFILPAMPTLYAVVCGFSTGDPNFRLEGPDNEDDAIAVSYTSGTTGNPKGVVTHHRGAALNSLSVSIT